MPITIDSRGVSVYITDDEARAQAAALASRAEQALDAADARGWSLNASDAARVQHDLDEAAKLLEEIGEYKQLSGPVDLARFYAPGESGDTRGTSSIFCGPGSEAVLAARATAEARRREQTRRMAATALMIEQLGEDDVEPTDNLTPERPNLKRTFDSHGLEWWTVSGRGDTKRYADYATAERELKRRAGRA